MPCVHEAQFPCISVVAIYTSIQTPVAQSLMLQKLRSVGLSFFGPIDFNRNTRRCLNQVYSSLFSRCDLGGFLFLFFLPYSRTGLLLLISIG